jgi:hypothetical protein
VLGQELPSLAHARDDVDDSRGKACLGEELPEQERSDGSLLCRFEDNRAPSCECRCDLPSHHEQGIVPGDDLRDYSNGFLPGVPEEGSTHGESAALDLVGLASEVAVDIGRVGDILCPGYADWLAVVESFEVGQEIAVLLDQVGKAEEQSPPRMRVHSPPLRRLECLPCRSDSQIDILLGGIDYFPDAGLRTGIGEGEGTPPIGVQVLPVDEELPLD